MLDAVQLRPKQTHVVFIKHAGLGQFDCEVKASLSSQCRQQSVRPFLLDDAADSLYIEWFNIDDICDTLVGHDGGWIGIDQHCNNTLFTQGLAGLRACVIELGSLADYDRPGTYDQDFARFRHLICFPLFHHLDKTLEQVDVILRSRRAFGMILNGKYWHLVVS